MISIKDSDRIDGHRWDCNGGKSMETADNTTWSQTARVYGSSLARSSRTRNSFRAGTDAPSRTALETSLTQLATMNDWLREALHRQGQVSAQLRLLVENAGQGTPAAAGVLPDRPAEPIMAAGYRENAETRAASLTARQREIMDLVLVGHPNKNIAADLQLSQRTVENHRAAVMKKMGASTLVDLVRVGLAIRPTNGSFPGMQSKKCFVAPCFS